MGIDPEGRLLAGSGLLRLCVGWGDLAAPNNCQWRAGWQAGWQAGRPLVACRAAGVPLLIRGQVECSKGAQFTRMVL